MSTAFPLRTRIGGPTLSQKGVNHYHLEISPPVVAVWPDCVTIQFLKEELEQLREAIDDMIGRREHEMPY
jgi:hypothetical protein